MKELENTILHRRTDRIIDKRCEIRELLQLFIIHKQTDEFNKVKR